MPRTPLDLHVARPEELRARIAAERRGAPFLLYRDGEDRQVIVELGEGRDRVTVGRSSQADIALHWDREVSRLHATLERIAGAWVLSDERLSRNGTFVNGERLATRRRLAPGDVIVAGASTIAFVAPGPGSVSATVVGDVHVPPVTPAQRRVLVALCRPLADGGAPASNREIAAELVVAVDTVKGTLSRLFETFGIGDDVPQNQKRAMLARRAQAAGVVGPDQ
ncbi:MAG: FHA domain-containing protein [Solirubrobacteraceae bacterium]